MNTMHRRALAGVGFLAVLALSAAGGAMAAAHDVSVTIKNFDFQPMSVTVPVGATVSWTNLDEEPHTVTSTNGAFRSEALDEGDVFRFRFTKPGTYKYLCTVHPKMVGTVVVK